MDPSLPVTVQELNVDDVVHFVGLDDGLEVEHVSGHDLTAGGGSLRVCGHGRGSRRRQGPARLLPEGEDHHFAAVDQHGSATAVGVSANLRGEKLVNMYVNVFS